MDMRMIRFGEIEVDGKRYDHDLMIKQGKVSKRKKGQSKPYRERFGHTPLSADEPIPWGGDQLIIGTGMYGSLPIMNEVYEEAEQRGVEIVAVKTGEACKVLTELETKEINAILHVTC